jgi:glycosyltransferase involved in cell wall biosynthesis
VRVCFISHSGHRGGAERVMLETIDVLCAHGVECRVVVPVEGELCTELTNRGIGFAVISSALWMSSGKFPFISRVLKDALSIVKGTVMVAWRIFRWRSDVVFSNTVTVCVGASASALLRRPHIWHLHEFGAEDHNLSFVLGERISSRLMRLFSRHYVCVSEILAKKYRHFVPGSSVTAIYPSMHLARPELDDSNGPGPPARMSGRRFRCVVVGALTEGKGQEQAIFAVAALKTRGVVTELVIAGEGACRSHLEAAVESNNLQSHVSFVGQVKNGLQLMKQADAVLMCSRSEGFGRVTIEGMLAGKPVIGARCGATAELIEDGFNGLLYSFGDANELADKIANLYRNPTLAQNLGRNARAWAERTFTKERYAKELLTVIHSLTPAVPRLHPPVL